MTDDQDRIDAARWRALRSGCSVDKIVDKLVQIAQEHKP